jgi:hypothetical protein
LNLETNKIIENKLQTKILFLSVVATLGTVGFTILIKSFGFDKYQNLSDIQEINGEIFDEACLFVKTIIG